MPCADGYFILAVGNDGQFARFCAFAGVPELAEDARFTTNADRVRNRVALYEILPEITRQKTQKAWVDGPPPLPLPAGPVNTLAPAFAHPQALARTLHVSLPYRSSRHGQAAPHGPPLHFPDTPPAP